MLYFVLYSQFGLLWLLLYSRQNFK
jgi:hypothetical protein